MYTVQYRSKLPKSVYSDSSLEDKLSFLADLTYQIQISRFGSLNSYKKYIIFQQATSPFN